jgi:chromosome segregation ATPase
MDAQKMMSDLDRLETEIDAAKTDLSRAEGRQQAILTQLQQEFQLTTIDEAQKLFEETVKEQKEKEAKLQEDYTSLKKIYEW